MDDLTKLGPLAGLVGTWEGEKGLDVSFHHADGDVGDTVYREKITFNPFGPVDNGSQQLFGLDYRMAAWRGDEVDPFHTEIGYWLWDPRDRQVTRCFLVPRGTMVLAGGTCDADATTFTMTAEVGAESYGILQNPYLVMRARTVHYEVTITVEGDTFTYSEDTVLDMAGRSELLHHTDGNTLRRVD